MLLRLVYATCASRGFSKIRARANGEKSPWEVFQTVDSIALFGVTSVTQSKPCCA